MSFLSLLFSKEQKAIATVLKRVMEKMKIEDEVVAKRVKSLISCYEASDLKSDFVNHLEREVAGELMFLVALELGDLKKLKSN